jgi:hypothetical protein
VVDKWKVCFAMAMYANWEDGNSLVFSQTTYIWKTIYFYVIYFYKIAFLFPFGAQGRETGYDSTILSY